MIQLQEALIRIAADLRALDLPWVLIGDLAVSVHAVPRTTRDVDVAVAVTGDPEAEQVVMALRGRGYRDYPHGAVLERRDRKRLAGYRFLTPGGEAGRASSSVRKPEPGSTSSPPPGTGMAPGI